MAVARRRLLRSVIWACQPPLDGLGRGGSAAVHAGEHLVEGFQGTRHLEIGQLGRRTRTAAGVQPPRPGVSRVTRSGSSRTRAVAPPDGRAREPRDSGAASPIEPVRHALLQRAVNPNVGHAIAPQEGPRAELVIGEELPAAEEVVPDVVDRPLDLALRLGPVRTARADPEAYPVSKRAARSRKRPWRMKLRIAGSPLVVCAPLRRLLGNDPHDSGAQAAARSARARCASPRTDCMTAPEARRGPESLPPCKR